VEGTGVPKKTIDLPLTLVVIGTDCIGSCKSDYHMIMMAPFKEMKEEKKHFQPLFLKQKLP
jgi:hypothetical protein